MVNSAREAEIQQVLRTARPDLGALRQQTKDWTVIDYEYAETRIQIDIFNDMSRKLVEPLLNKLHEQRREHEVQERRHKELMAAAKDTKKKPSATMPDAPDLVWAIKHLNVMGWVALVSLCATFLVVGINLAKVSQVREYFEIYVPPEIQIQKVEVPKIVSLPRTLTPELEKRVTTLFDEHSKRMRDLELDLSVRRHGVAVVAMTTAQMLQGGINKPLTEEQIMAAITAEQRSFAASLELLEAMAKQPQP